MVQTFDAFIHNHDTYPYGCAMLYFDFPEMENIHSMINPVDVYIDENDPASGLQNTPHVTLLYGFLKEVTSHQIAKIVSWQTYGKAKIHNASIFDNEKYDILKFDVEANELYEVNKKLKVLPHVSKFPVYCPHMTIGEMKKGSGKKYADMLSEIEYFLKPSHCVYNAPDGEKHEIEIVIE